MLCSCLWHYCLRVVSYLVSEQRDGDNGLKLRDRTLGTQGRALIAACVGRIPAKDLFEYLVKQHDWTFRGFQPKFSNLPHARKRFCDCIRTDQLTAPSEQLHDYLYNATTVFFACVFSEQALRDHWRSWAKCLGVDVVLGGMLFDPRDAVFRMAMDALEDEAFSMEAFEVTDESIAEATRELQTAFEPLLGLIQSLTQTQALLNAPDAAQKSDSRSINQTSAGQTSSTKASLNAVEAKLKASEKELRKLKGDLVSEQQQFNNLKSSHTSLEEAFATLKSQAIANEATIKALNESLASANHGVDLRVKLEVREHLASSLRTWIKPLEAMENALQGEPTELLARTEQLLAEQAQQDQAFGNRALLRLRIAELEQAKTKLREARLYAIKPLSALASLESEIDIELENLQCTLQAATKPTSKDPVVTKLEMSLNAQDSFEGLVAFRRFLRGCINQGLVKKADGMRLDEMARHHAMRLNDRVLVNAEFYSASSDAAGDTDTLAIALALGEPHRILLDGYNLIFDALGPTIAATDHNDPKSTRTAIDEGRLALIEQVKISIAVHPALEVRIFLDSPRGGVEQVNERLSLHYSGGTGANRADHDIAGYLAYLRKQNDSLPTTVISNDLAVQQNAQSHQAHCLRSDRFWALF